MTSLEINANTSVCPRCGAGLRCGNIAGDAQCWCSQLPNIMPVPPAPGAVSKDSTRAAPTPADAGSDTAGLAPDDTPLAASCLCPACLKQITEAAIHAATQVNLAEVASPK